jgi:hypothetical protein
VSVVWCQVDSLRRVDHSSRGVVPRMVRCIKVCSRNLIKEARSTRGCRAIIKKMSRPALGSTGPRFRYIRDALSLSVKQLVIEVTTYHHLVPRLRMNGALPPFIVRLLLVQASVEISQHSAWVYTSFT